MSNKLFLKKEKAIISKRIMIALLVLLVSMILAITIVSSLADNLTIDRYLLQGLILSSLIITSIWFIRTKLDKRHPHSIGVGILSQALLKFGLGLGLFLIPITITIITTILFDWATITFNTVTLMPILVSVLAIVLFEAIPEEFIFRGYIYSNLNTIFKRWKASLITIGLFIAFPIIIVQIQRVLGIEVQIGNASAITLKYLITLLLFSLFVQYLRVLTNSIWAGVGFHLFIVFMNRLMGTSKNHLIQLSDVNDETPMQIIFSVLLLIVFIGLLLYPKLKKKSLGWYKYALE
ncbi:MAG: CPBP family intramembrane metalloprotease [Flavobacteriaceae bacterium]|nr:CPBP family intramembrane metalloprotease [Flavobacteriaceae bacterium]